MHVLSLKDLKKTVAVEEKLYIGAKVLNTTIYLKLKSLILRTMRIMIIRMTEFVQMKNSRW